MLRRGEPGEQGVREMAFKQREEGPKAPSPAVKPASPPSETPLKSAPKTMPERLMSLDAFRGFTMLLMASDGWGISDIVRNNSEMLTRFDGHWYGKPWKVFWNTAAWQLQHVAWTGCVAWDLIQPAFTFMVGVSMPFSYAKREARGDSWGIQFWHALVRSLILIGLGIFLRSTGSSMTVFTFEDTLTQIGLGYIFVFILLRAPFVAQCVAVLVILGGYWFAFYRYPLPPPEGNRVTQYLTSHNVNPKDWNQFTDAGLRPAGIAPHWNKHTNAAAAADRVFLNLFPRGGQPWEGKKFWINGGGYQTLSFIPCIVTMLFGVMAGQMLRRPWTPGKKLAALMAAGLGCLVVSMAIDTTIWPFHFERLNYSLCPIVKRIWTPSWTVFSAGWAFWFLGLFYWAIDMRGHRRFGFPLAIVGMNSILVYCLHELVGRGMHGWLSNMLEIHLRTFDQGVHGLIVKLSNRLPSVGNLSFVRWMGHASVTDFFYSHDSIYQPIWHEFAILFLIWLICLWLYRRRIFVRV
jgi:heparan-alpha-glucosaminide N-acetyltransferase